MIHDTPLIGGLSELAGAYDALLCDVWGVLHNGEAAHPGVVDALSRFRAQGGAVLLISNAPRPGGLIPSQLTRLGIPADAYDDILTSGDVTRTLLASGTLGHTCFHIGPERDLPLFDGLDLSRVPEADADFTVCTGLYDDETETPENYRDQLTRLQTRKQHLVCANPDIVVERGSEMIYCAGALARFYEEIGGAVTYLGKPYAPIYETARTRLAKITGKPVPDPRILAVGDGVLTDIAGAHAQKIDALFVTGGIAWEACGDRAETPDPERVTRFCAEAGVRPRAALPRLVW